MKLFRAMRRALSLVGLATAPAGSPMPVASAGRGLNALKKYFLAVGVRRRRGPIRLAADRDCPLNFEGALEARRKLNLGHKHQRAWIVDEHGRMVRCMKRDRRRTALSAAA